MSWSWRATSECYHNDERSQFECLLLYVVGYLVTSECVCDLPACAERDEYFEPQRCQYQVTGRILSLSAAFLLQMQPALASARVVEREMLRDL